MRMDRKSLKSNAKVVLKKYFVMLFVVSLIMALVGGSTGGVENRFGHGSRDNTIKFMKIGDFDFSDELSDVRYNLKDNKFFNKGADFVSRNLSELPLGRIANLFFRTSIMLLALAFVCAIIFFSLFIAFPVLVGGSRIYIDTADGEHAPELGRLALAFRSGHYVNIVKAGFLKALYEFLWSLLFIIPGVIKGYAYRMVPFILADNPELNASDALRLSEDMMRGHKWELFVLDLSFIGWYMLGSLLFGVGRFLVHPYKDATVVQYYLQLRAGYMTGPATDSAGYVRQQ